MSASAIEAVDSSPCICDQRSTEVGPLPNVTDRIARPLIDRPICSERSAPDASDGVMALQNRSWVKRRVVIAATRNRSAMRRPSARAAAQQALGAPATGGRAGEAGAEVAGVRTAGAQAATASAAESRISDGRVGVIPIYSRRAGGARHGPMVSTAAEAAVAVTGRPLAESPLTTVAPAPL